MDAKTANKFYESNRKFFSDKITLLDLALAALEDATGEADRKGTLEGACYDLNDFMDKQAGLIFEEIMDLGSYQIDEMS